MEGEEIRNKLLEAGFKLSVVAKDMNISHQAFFSKLDSKDVKVSLIYDICNATGLDLSYFLDKYLSSEQRKYSIELAAKDRLILEQSEEIVRLRKELDRYKK